MSLAVHTVRGLAPSVSRSLGQTYHAAHWEPGVGTGGRQLHQWWPKLCVQKGWLLVVQRSVKVVMISTLQRLSSVHSLRHQR